MSLLLDIQDAAVDSKSDLASLLRRCKVLAARLASEPLADWLLWEANGYPDNIALPDYRVWGVLLRGHFSGYFGAGLRNATIPQVCLPAQLQKATAEFQCRHSVASIESLLADAKQQSLTFSRPDLAVAIGSSLYADMNCVEAWGEFGTDRLVNVLNAVRNRILDFVLAISKEDPNAGETGSHLQKLEPRAVTQIFNTTVYGGANIVGKAHNSALTVNVTANDRDSLFHQLRQHGVSEEDVDVLASAIEAEPKKPHDGRFGPRVAEWLASMVGKAATGVWEIGVGAAGNFLASALAQYYGVGS